MGKTNKPKGKSLESKVPQVIEPKGKDDPAPKVETVGKPEALMVPLNLFLAALSCTAPKAMPLNGVFIHKMGVDLRVVGTDGSRMFVGSFKVEAKKIPAWAEKGILISNENLKPRVGLLDKMADSKDLALVRVTHAANTNRCELSDGMLEVVFKQPLVDAKFPEYDKILGSLAGAFDPSSRRDLEPVGFQGKYLKHLGEVGKILGSEHVGVFTAGGTDATVITFSQHPGAVMVLMPVRMAAEMPVETTRILGPAIRATVAALKAHETRNRQWAEQEGLSERERKDYLEKAEDFAKRVASVMERTQMNRALPAPKPVEVAPVEPEPQPEPRMFQTREENAAELAREAAEADGKEGDKPAEPPAPPAEPPANTPPAPPAKEPEPADSKAAAQKKRRRGRANPTGRVSRGVRANGPATH